MRTSHSPAPIGRRPSRSPLPPPARRGRRSTRGGSTSQTGRRRSAARLPGSIPVGTLTRPGPRRHASARQAGRRAPYLVIVGPREPDPAAGREVGPAAVLVHGRSDSNTVREHVPGLPAPSPGDERVALGASLDPVHGPPVRLKSVERYARPSH